MAGFGFSTRRVSGPFWNVRRVIYVGQRYGGSSAPVYAVKIGRSSRPFWIFRSRGIAWGRF